MGISHGVPGTAGASIPYCENIIGVIDHVPISLVPVSYTHLAKSLLNLIEKAMNKPVTDRDAENTLDQFGASLA